jgi:CBS domain-containing protein
MDEVGHRDREPRLQARRLEVADVMSSPVITIQTSESLWSAVERFLATGVRHLVVLSGHRCVGVISDRHVIGAWPFDPLGMRRRRVGEVLREEFPAVVPACPLALAAELMVEHHVDALPVVDDEATVVGVLTSSDVVRAVAKALG